MKVAVTGATGQLGQLVITELKKKISSEKIVALARNLEKASKLGVEARQFDYDKPDNLAALLEGIDHLLLISGSEIGKRAEQHTNVINAAKTAGVKWIVYTSLLHADDTSISLAPEHIKTEKVLKESGIDYTILRHGWYSENYTASIVGALSAGAFIGSAKDGKISSAPRADFAEAATIVITDENYKAQTLEFAGDSAYTLTEFAAEITKQSGKDIPYNDLPETEYANILKNVGLPESFALAIANWDVSASKGDLFDDSKTLSKVLGRPTTPISESIKIALA